MCLPFNAPRLFRGLKTGPPHYTTRPACWAVTPSLLPTRSEVDGYSYVIVEHDAVGINIVVDESRDMKMPEATFRLLRQAHTCSPPFTSAVGGPSSASGRNRFADGFGLWASTASIVGAQRRSPDATSDGGGSGSRVNLDGNGNGGPAYLLGRYLSISRHLPVERPSTRTRLEAMEHHSGLLTSGAVCGC